jgi:hypothetical protein
MLELAGDGQQNDLWLFAVILRTADDDRWPIFGAGVIGKRVKDVDDLAKPITIPHV